jgi:hypothetical protein
MRVRFTPCLSRSVGLQISTTLRGSRIQASSLLRKSLRAVGPVTRADMGLIEIGRILHRMCDYLNASSERTDFFSADCFSDLAAQLGDLFRDLRAQ